MGAPWDETAREDEPALRPRDLTAEEEVVHEDPGRSIPDRGLASFMVGVFGDVHIAAWPAQTRGSAEWVQCPNNLLYSTTKEAVTFH